MSQMKYHKLSLINSDWQSMLACCMHYLNFLHIIIIHFILCAEICVDTAVTCTESGCTECKTGYVGLGCCDCAPGFSRDENDDCICKNMYIKHNP